MVCDQDQVVSCCFRCPIPKTFLNLFSLLVVKFWFYLYMFTVAAPVFFALCFMIRIKLFHAVSSEGEIECFRFSGTLHAGFIDGAYWLISTPSLTNWNLPDTIYFNLSWVQTDFKLSDKKKSFTRMILQANNNIEHLDLLEIFLFLKKVSFLYNFETVISNFFFVLMAFNHST